MCLTHKITRLKVVRIQEYTITTRKTEITIIMYAYATTFQIVPSVTLVHAHQRSELQICHIEQAQQQQISRTTT